jgi:hypothetical protein
MNKSGQGKIPDPEKMMIALIDADLDVLPEYSVG